MILCWWHSQIFHFQAAGSYTNNLAVRSSSNTARDMKTSNPVYPPHLAFYKMTKAKIKQPQLQNLVRILGCSGFTGKSESVAERPTQHSRAADQKL